jgi:hypothetical protein
MADTNGCKGSDAGEADVRMKSMTRVDRLLTAAGDTMARVADCWAATPSENGGVNVRVSDPFLGCPARRAGPFGLRRGAARARRRIFNAPAGSHLAISIIPTAPMLRSSAEPHSSKTDAKFDAAGLRNGVSSFRAARMIPIRFLSG